MLETLESQQEGHNSNSYRPILEKRIPYIQEWQLRAMSYIHDSSEDDSNFYRVTSPYESYIYAFCGPRGSGKDESLSLIAILFLASELPVWLNYPLKFYYKRNGDEHYKLYEAQLLDMNKLLNHSTEYEGGLIGISEYQDWDNAMRSQTNQSLLLHAFWGQIRKGDLSFAYTTKRLEDIAGKTSSETDIVTTCQDHTEIIEDYEYDHPRGRGALVLWNPIIDMSGYLTRRMNTFLKPMLQPMYCLWGCYNTKERFDFFEAMRGVKFDFEKRVIGDGDDSEDYIHIDYEVIKHRTQEIFQSYDKIAPSDFWDTIGIDYNNAQKNKIKKYLENEMGIVSRQQAGHWYFRQLGEA